MGKPVKSTFNLPNLDDRLPVYDSVATIGDTTNGKAPNITGWFNTNGAYQSWDSVLFTGVETGNNSHGWSGSGTQNTKFNFDASKVSPVFDSSATGITPAGTFVLWCIKF